MASNDTTASGTVVWQDGDDLDEQNLPRAAAKSNQTDYVERGLTVTLDGANDTVDIGSGHAVIQDGQEAYDVFPDQQTNISLPNTGGSNYIFLVHDPATDDDVRYHIDDDDSPPADPSLKIAIADTSADSVTPLHQAPAAEFDNVSVTNKGEFGAVDTDQVTGDVSDSNTISSLYIQGYDNVIDSRSFDTEYQNTTGSPLKIHVVAKTDTSGDDNRTRLRSAPTSGSTSGIDAHDILNSDQNERTSVQAIIPDGHYYNVRQFGGNVSIDQWKEAEMYEVA